MRVILIFFYILFYNITFSQTFTKFNVCKTNNGSISLDWAYDNDTCSDSKVIIKVWKSTSGLTTTELFDTTFIQDRNYLYTEVTQPGVSVDSFMLLHLCNNSIIDSSTRLKADETAPNFNTINFITYNENNEAIINWNQPTDDERGFILYEFDNQRFRPYDTIFDRSINSYTYINDSVANFSLSSFDTCFNISTIGSNHKAIDLKYSIDSCENLLNLNFTEYEGIDDLDYRVFLYDINGDTISYSLDNNTYSAKLLNNIEYEFYISASNGFIVTNSKRYIINTKDISNTPKPFIRSISNNSDFVQLMYYIDNIYTFAYVRYGGVPNRPTDSIQLNLSENTIDIPNVFDSLSPMYFSISAYTNCDNIAKISDFVNLVWAYGSRNINTDLEWNNYLGYNRYDNFISRTYSTFNQNYSSLLIQTESNKLIDIDTFANYILPGVCYRVLYTIPTLDSLGFKDTSYSNEICFIDEPIVYVPNAINISSDANIFKPVISFYDESKTFMNIYNRWGQLVKEVDNTRTGWNVKDENVQAGLYIYTLHVTSLNNKTRVFKGYINVL
jgi:hypothetical protein